MALQTIPAAVVVIGLILYTLLAGADFGAGVWQLSAGGGEHGRRIRDHAHHANAPVWEANHVWLILVITVLWTAYPSVFGAIFSTLAIPIFLAALGIIGRGTSYALQNAANARQRRYIDLSFAAASIVTPYMLGSVIGAIASGRVPPGNALGAEVGSWTSATSILAGLLAVATGAFLAAVFLAADAERLREPDLVESFRGRALLAGVVAGGLAVGGLFVVRADAPRLFDGLTSGWGLVPVVVSGVAGLVSMALVVLRRFTQARLSAALAVAAVIIGWAVAQRPYLLPTTVTIEDAAANDTTMIALIVSLAVGAVVLFPSLVLLFRLTLAGRFDPTSQGPAPVPGGPVTRERRKHAAQTGIGFLITGVVLLTIAEPAVAHIFGLIFLGIAMFAGFRAVGPVELASRPAPEVAGRSLRELLRRPR
ncbi:cytochrome D ubiquinol oxidase subunit II [Asanoa ishikariensis]|uniref:Cytochrome bd-I ubiquinol oxidase subunit 2 apoprotein n=1 Tax=Asanoa ishikariensis TaxID=137265 RepID=A0A1H3R9D9_9ACTN|nr:cytochrome d ubiquinol oxidase subunit II [Asanoa ishikariensis]GIF64334.1 cytochrome D ubiquinol oxidase subunit II [Asanoa ishikariensis]SDZ21589.1 cytochrome bd-I ubiquinol oxidase subunit 2 apoprotein [Asanoa ishikariensis]